MNTKEMTSQDLKVKIYDNRSLMGAAAAAAAGHRIRELLENKAEVNIIFAAAPSQNEFLAALLQENLDWSQINAFHMDEYVGLNKDASQGFGNFLKDRLFGKAPFRSVHYLNGNAEDLEQECRRYSNLLAEHPTDIVCMGIGENAHIAFNDPHVADFQDPKLVKVVDLDEECRNQQVNDGCFQAIGEVPTHALTLTVPALTKAGTIFCMVPGERKAVAVYHTINGEVTETYPSTILRNHADAILFLDQDSSKLVKI
jgi:glucosamine-6-phosphate deaminase